MKPILFVLLGLVTATTASTQVVITQFERTGLLAWTNHLCTPRPVYEVLSADSVIGPWQHLVFVTNQTAFATTNPPGSGPGNRFYKLQWVDDAPLVLDYLFDEGYGCPAVSGQLTLKFWEFPNAGTRTFSEEVCNFDGYHPLGTAPMVGAWYSANGLALLLQRGFDDSVFLEGTLERSNPSSPCSYTRFSGYVFQETIAGAAEAIGTFYAQPAR